MSWVGTTISTPSGQSAPSLELGVMVFAQPVLQWHRREWWCGKQREKGEDVASSRYGRDMRPQGNTGGWKGYLLLWKQISTSLFCWSQNDLYKAVLALNESLQYVRRYSVCLVTAVAVPVTLSQQYQINQIPARSRKQIKLRRLTRCQYTKLIASRWLLNA